MAENVNNVVCVMETNFVLGKNGGHKPCGLGIKSIIVVSEWDKIAIVDKHFKIL